MIPMDPISLPFCVLDQSNTVVTRIELMYGYMKIVSNSRSKVKKVSVNSTPENRARKKKCSFRRAFRTAMRPSTVRLIGGGTPFPFECFPFPLVCGTEAFAFASDVAGAALPLVSGRATIRKAVSATSRIKVKIAGAAYTLSSGPQVPVKPGKGRDAK